jgi:hypothetical protein
VTATAASAVLSVAGCQNPAPAGPGALPALSVLPVLSAPPSPATVQGSPGTSRSNALGSPTGPPASRPSNKRAAVTAVTAVTSVVRRYYEIANHLRHDMDFRALAALFTANCFCRIQVRAVRAAARRGEHYVDQATLNSVVTNIDGPRLADVLVDLNVSRGGLVSADGVPVTRAAPRHLKRVFRLERVPRGWLISDIEAA